MQGRPSASLPGCLHCFLSSRILPAWAGFTSVGRFFGSWGHHELECMFQWARGDTMNSSVGSGEGPTIQGRFRTCLTQTGPKPTRTFDWAYSGTGTAAEHLQ